MFDEVGFGLFVCFGLICFVRCFGFSDCGVCLLFVVLVGVFWNFCGTGVNLVFVCYLFGLFLWLALIDVNYVYVVVLIVSLLIGLIGLVFCSYWVVCLRIGLVD